MLSYATLKVFPCFQVPFEGPEALTMLLICANSMPLVLNLALLAEQSLFLALVFITNCNRFLIMIFALFILPAQPP